MSSMSSFESSMRSSTSWITIDTSLREVSVRVTLSLGSLDHYLSYHSILSDMTSLLLY